MKNLAYPGIVLLPIIFYGISISCNNYYDPPRNCPQYNAVWKDADSNYKGSGKLQAYTLSDSFSQLSVGNSWSYMYTIFHYANSQNWTTRCGDLSFTVTQIQGNEAIFQVIGVGSSGLYTLFDSLQVTNDSIINLNKNIFSLLSPVFMGSRNNIFPCFKFDDTDGYSNARQMVYDSSGINYNVKLEYFKGFGLMFLDYMQEGLPNNINECCYELEGFNMGQVNERQHINEGIAKYIYFEK